jgi:hypothetical protein
MRTAEPAPFLPTIVKLTTEARETAATELFAIEAVRVAITQAAMAGKMKLFLRPKSPLDLQQTDAAKALVAHLADLGLTTFWHPFSLDQGGRSESGTELEIGWHKAG